MFFAVFIMFYLSFTVVLTNEYDEVEEPLLPDDSFVQDVEQDDGYDAYAKIIPRSNSNSDCVQKILGSLRESIQKIQQDLSDLEKYVVSSDSSKTETGTEIESPADTGDNSENCDTESPTGAGAITPLNVTIEDSPPPPSGNEFDCNTGANSAGNTGTNSGGNIDANSGGNIDGNIGGNVGGISGSNTGSVNNSSSSSNTECETPQANHDSKSKAWDKQVTVCKEILQNTNKNLMEALAGLFPEKRRTIKIRTKKRNHHEKNQNSKRNDFSWSEWSSWSPCSVSCGSGKQIRYRKCAGEACQADIEMDHRQCFKPNCDQDLYKVLRMF